MNKFIVKPNKTLKEIIELNKKHTQNLIHEIRSNKLKKERRESQLHRKYF